MFIVSYNNARNFISKTISKRAYPLQKLKTILRKFALSQRVLRSLQLQFQSAALSLATARFSGHWTAVKAITNISEILGGNPHKINSTHCLVSETISDVSAMSSMCGVVCCFFYSLN